MFKLADFVVELQVLRKRVEPVIVSAGVLFELHRLPVQRVEMLAEDQDQGPEREREQGPGPGPRHDNVTMQGPARPGNREAGARKI